MSLGSHLHFLKVTKIIFYSFKLVSTAPYVRGCVHTCRMFHLIYRFKTLNKSYAGGKVTSRHITAARRFNLVQHERAQYRIFCVDL
jgi:hypothetical protein